MNYQWYKNYNEYKQSKALKDIKKYENSHGYHLVSPSPWPFCTALSIFGLTVTFLLTFQEMQPLGKISLFLFTIHFLMCLKGWWRDVTVEATYQGEHTLIVQQGLRYGFI